MTDCVIRVENLGKQYRIGGLQEPYRRLSETITATLAHPLSHLARTGRRSGNFFWALKGVSFEVRPGEVVGIIGRNGAGKSTLLKILARITKPTEGRAEIRGRVGSLLEVGTGFHPELTGRENIYLNGAILGMRRAEIERKFDEIVAFAEIEKFLDTPVKRYSSGMHVRLAFAIAAHLEPEILFVDEVLAVGDMAFQKKCLNKMGDVARAGRTILLVSHNMVAISSLCERAMLLDAGTVAKEGRAAEVVQAYLNRGDSATSQKVWRESEGPGNSSFHLLAVRLRDAGGAVASETGISEGATVEVEFEVVRDGARVTFSLVLFDANGYCAFSSLSNTDRNYGNPLGRGRYLSTCHMYGHLLNNGRYHVSIIGVSDYWTDGFRADHVITFEAVDDGVLRRDYPGNYSGATRPKLAWASMRLA